MKSSTQGSEQKKQMHATNQAERRILDAVQSSTNQLQDELSKLRRTLIRSPENERALLVSTWQSTSDMKLAPVVEKVRLGLADLAHANFLSTLQFDQVYDRYKSVTEAHNLTYHWAVQRDSRRDEQWDDLATWFESPTSVSQIYWVTGRPGCGKSTLMRFLANSPNTKALLARWTGEQPLLVAQCYFWAPGSEMQKSLDGMLRSLLLQLLGDPAVGSAIIENVSPARWYRSFREEGTAPSWTVPELLGVFRLVVEQIARESYVMLFVDGLDEYGKDNAQRTELVRLFTSLKELGHLKMCLSSRPWNIFNDAFQRLPSLKLEKLNRPDIEKYVMDECSKSEAFQELSAIDPDRAIVLRNTIVEKSSSVFLWVNLVTRRLLTEMQDGAGLIYAEKILHEMPPDLNKYFKFMLDSIRPSDRPQASRIYQTMVMHQSSNPLTLMFLSFAGEDETSFAQAQAFQHMTVASIQTRVKAMERYFNSQTMDLLVYKKGPNFGEVPWDDLQVDYLHRTVAEFLQTPLPQELLRSYTGEDFCVPWYCVNALVSQIMYLRHAEDMTKVYDVILDHFIDLTRNLPGVPSVYDAEMVTYFTNVAPRVIEATSRSSSVPALLKPFESKERIDDSELFLGILFDVFAFVEKRLKERVTRLPHMYCDQYASAVGGSARMLALLVRHTDPSCPFMWLPDISENRRDKKEFACVADAEAFGNQFADGIRNLDFDSRRARYNLSIYVDHIMDLVCSSRKTILNSSIAKARLTWTVRGDNTYHGPAVEYVPSRSARCSKTRQRGKLIWRESIPVRQFGN